VLRLGVAAVRAAQVSPLEPSKLKLRIGVAVVCCLVVPLERNLQVDFGNEVAALEYLTELKLRICISAVRRLVVQFRRLRQADLTG